MPGTLPEAAAPAGPGCRTAHPARPAPEALSKELRHLLPGDGESCCRKTAGFNSSPISPQQGELPGAPPHHPAVILTRTWEARELSKTAIRHIIAQQ